MSPRRSGSRVGGDALGCGGHLSRLRRTRVGSFTLADAVPLDDVSTERLMPMDAAARRAFPLVSLSAEEAADALHGRAVPWRGAQDDAVHALMAPDGGLVALAQRGASGARLLAVLGSVPS